MNNEITCGNSYPTLYAYASFKSYGRKNPRRSAKFIYNHILCPEDYSMGYLSEQLLVLHG